MRFDVLIRLAACLVLPFLVGGCMTKEQLEAHEKWLADKPAPRLRTLNASRGVAGMGHSVMHDDDRSVTCWEYWGGQGAHGISCLPDSMLVVVDGGAR